MCQIPSGARHCCGWHKVISQAASEAFLTRNLWAASHLSDEERLPLKQDIINGLKDGRCIFIHQVHGAGDGRGSRSNTRHYKETQRLETGAKNVPKSLSYSCFSCSFAFTFLCLGAHCFRIPPCSMEHRVHQPYLSPAKILCYLL